MRLHIHWKILFIPTNGRDCAMFANIVKTVKNQLNGRAYIHAISLENINKEGITEALKKFKLKSEEVLVVQDDSDIVFGNFKIVFLRGSAGHKGIESIFKNLNSKKIWRLRIGARPISLKGKTHQKAETFILKKISQEEIKKLPLIFEKILSKLKNNNLN